MKGRARSGLRSEIPTVGFVEGRACCDAAPSFLLLFLIWNQKMIETLIRVWGEIDAQAVITAAQNMGLKQFKAEKEMKLTCKKEKKV